MVALKGQNKQSTKQSVHSSTHHNLFCREATFVDPGKTAVSWQSLGFTPRTDRNCGEPDIYIHVKCNTFQTNMKLTGESDPQHLDEL